MKHVLACTLVLTLLLACGTALAYEPKVWDDYSWWATSGAQPDPVKDAVAFWLLVVADRTSLECG